MLLLSDPSMERHDPGAMHPERPDRLRAVHRALDGARAVRWQSPTPASREQVARVHAAHYIDRIDALAGQRGALDPDTHVSEDSVAAAYLAAGSVIDAVEAVCGGAAERAFALVRPPGHHAEAQAAMGFCLFNNVAVAAEHARAALGIERVLVVDWDVHHGNGTQHSFSARRDVLFFSTHQFPFYPGSGDVDEVGDGEGAGYTVNVPFHAGCGDSDYVAAFQDVLVPIADRFAPELVLVSAGFDAHRDDPLASMNASDEGYAALMSIVMDIAARHAGGKLVLTLEGGYDLDALGRSVRACVDVAAGATPPVIRPTADRGQRVLARVAAQHREQWKL